MADWSAIVKSLKDKPTDVASLTSSASSALKLLAASPGPLALLFCSMAPKADSFPCVSASSGSGVESGVVVQLVQALKHTEGNATAASKVCEAVCLLVVDSG